MSGENKIDAVFSALQGGLLAIDLPAPVEHSFVFDPNYDPYKAKDSGEEWSSIISKDEITIWHLNQGHAKTPLAKRFTSLPEYVEFVLKNRVESIEPEKKIKAIRVFGLCVGGSFVKNKKHKKLMKKVHKYLKSKEFNDLEKKYISTKV